MSYGKGDTTAIFTGGWFRGISLTAGEAIIEQIMAAVAAEVNTAALTDSEGHAIAAAVEVPPNFEDVTEACVKVFPDGDDVTPNHSQTNEGVYRVNVALCELVSAADVRFRHMKNREAVQDLFVGSRLVGMPAYYCRGVTSPSAISLEALEERHHGISVVTLEFVALRSRG